MEVEIGKAEVAETPASAMAEKVIEHVAAIMMLVGGIESISSTKYVCGFGDRLHVSISPFTSAPSKILSQGVVIKDALATIMSVANISRILVKPSETDLTGVEEAWKNAVETSDQANGASAAPETSGSSDVEGR